jgi:hypothetical protein
MQDILGRAQKGARNLSTAKEKKGVTMPKFKDVIPEDFVPTPEQLECFQKALSELNDNIRSAYDSSTHEESFGIGPLKIRWSSTDEDQYKRLKDDAERQYQAHLRRCKG